VRNQRAYDRCMAMRTSMRDREVASGLALGRSRCAVATLRNRVCSLAASYWKRGRKATGRMGSPSGPADRRSGVGMTGGQGRRAARHCSRRIREGPGVVPGPSRGTRDVGSGSDQTQPVRQVLLFPPLWQPLLRQRPSQHWSSLTQRSPVPMQVPDPESTGGQSPQ
jgi:hypothetical protein